MRLGDLDAVKKRMGEFWFGDPAVELFVDDLVDGTPTIDAVPVVRCKDCKHHFDGEHTDKCCEVLMEKAKWQIEIVTDDDWFCADGEKK